jgi:hypothetical protein
MSLVKRLLDNASLLREAADRIIIAHLETALTRLTEASASLENEGMSIDPRTDPPPCDAERDLEEA